MNAHDRHYHRDRALPAVGEKFASRSWSEGCFYTSLPMLGQKLGAVNDYGPIAHSSAITCVTARFLETSESAALELQTSGMQCKMF